MPSRLMFVGIVVALTGGCAPHEEGESKEPGERAVIGQPQPEPEPEPEPAPLAKVAKASIASVQMIQDCPDAPASPPPPPAAAADEAPSESRAVSAGAARKPGGGPISQPCTQSTMQLSFTGQGPEAAKVRIEAVRLHAASGEKLGTLTARGPTAWTDGGYQAWDETLKPETDLKASYKLSVPNWNDVEAALGDKNPFETMFVLEVDVEIDGQRQTIRSPEFVRERPHVIVT